MTVSEIRDHDTVAVSLIRWTPSGKVQVMRRREVDGPHGPIAIFGVYYAVPPMKLQCDAGREALAKILRELPQ